MKAPSRAMTVAEALDEGTSRLAKVRPRTPRLDAELLLGHVLSMTRTELFTHTQTRLSAAQVAAYRDLVERRSQGVPVAYLVGWREFYSRRFWVSPRVLIPRGETEVVVEEGLALLERQGLTRARVLDVGTGSGVIAITMAMEVPTAEVVATDVEAQALEQAAENVAHHGLEGRVRLEQGDLFGPVKGERFDLILSNPPYVGTDFGPRPEPAVVQNEPSGALYSGCHGLDLIERLVAEAPDYLHEGGGLVIELAPFQAERVEAWMQERGFRNTRLVPDLSGLPRVATGLWEDME